MAEKIRYDLRCARFEHAKTILSDVIQSTEKIRR